MGTKIRKAEGTVNHQIGKASNKGSTSVIVVALSSDSLWKRTLFGLIGGEVHDNELGGDPFIGSSSMLMLRDVPVGGEFTGGKRKPDRTRPLTAGGEGVNSPPRRKFRTGLLDIASSLSSDRLDKPEKVRARQRFCAKKLVRSILSWGEALIHISSSPRTRVTALACQQKTKQQDQCNTIKFCLKTIW